MRRLTWEIAIASVLGALTLLAYIPCLRGDFVNYDDPEYVSENAHVCRGLTGEGVAWAWTTTHAANWHPLTWLSLQLDAQLFGGAQPWGYHLTNIVLHAANALLLFRILRRLTGAIWRSAMVAALFALHPLHVESVAWIAERKDTLATLFGLLSLIAYVRYAAAPSSSRYAWTAITLALGLLAKPMLVTWPFVMLLLDYWPLRRLRDPMAKEHLGGACHRE